MAFYTNRYARRFLGEAAHVAEARGWVRSRLPADCPRADDVVLAVSELVTNVVLHTDALFGSCEVHLVVDPRSVAITVADQGPAMSPADRPARDGGGYGLAIVEDLADAFTVERGPDGWTVWCLICWKGRY